MTFRFYVRNQISIQLHSAAPHPPISYAPATPPLSMLRLHQQLQNSLKTLHKHAENIVYVCARHYAAIAYLKIDIFALYGFMSDSNTASQSSIRLCVVRLP